MLRVFLFFGIIATRQCNGFLTSLLEFGNQGNCTENQFHCINKECIPKEKRCDGTFDCIDSSDELDCDYFLCRDTMFFKCKNGRCISKSFVCDDENDCEDYSDEENCTNYKFTHNVDTPCEENEWRCSDKLCILKDWVCNGEADCLDGSDETIGCTLSLVCDGFKCKNNHCIPNEWRCDGSNDCIDNSDEEHCEDYRDPKTCTWDNKKFLCANNHTCIDVKNVCDGKHNCPDKSDEGILCYSPTSSCSTANCSHTCVQLPTGPKCYCPSGYRTLNEKECEDINECEIYGTCDQKCRNTPGSYECYCDHKYMLQEDKRTCKALNGEAMMIFSSKTQIRAYFLQSEIYFPIASQLKQVVGVAYDGTHVYWSDIFSEHESIVKSLEDGSEREILLTSGLGSPEDIAVDTLTGNIYFTDAEYKHIGVCTPDGRHCTVLLNKDIRKPRGIVLDIQNGEMYWTDWGEPAGIEKSYMDGSFDRTFVSDNIHWPNGLTIDLPNERLYWTDAKILTLESIKLDGTDRRIVLEAVVKHPYSIAVFENRLYWSDWHSHTIQSCDKFTGKDHHTIIKEKKDFIYGLTIYHSSQQIDRTNPCALAFCSDICLLKGTDGYSCACPQNKMLSSDHHTCKYIEEQQFLVLAAKNVLVHIEHQFLGRHTVSPVPLVVQNVGALAYNPINNTLYVSDLDLKKIIKLSMSTGLSEDFEIEGLGKVTSMDYDYNGRNLYWSDEEKGSIEIMNIDNMARKTLLNNLNDEIPEAISLVPEHGVMFVSFRRKSDRISHLDRMLMDGTGRTHVMEDGTIGPIDIYYDRDLHRVFFADAGTGNIETTSIEGDDRHKFHSLNTNPVSISGLKSDLFWISEHSEVLNWANKYNVTYAKRVVLDSIPDNLNRMHLISLSPLSSFNGGCSVNNGNCSHLCIASSRKSIICACPNHMQLSNDRQKCIEKKYCDLSEFKCVKSNECIKIEQRCNGISECTFGEDEEDCRPKNHCPADYFMCNDGNCIEDHKVCNMVYDCKDRSDEHKCSYSNKCPPGHFRCSDVKCIPDKFVCDGNTDCPDRSDELNCEASTCNLNQFRCDSGACIPKTWECDRDYDCPDMSDEHPNCPITCSPGSLTCANGKCVEKSFVCDGTDDCGDNTDETNCDASKKNECGAKEFQCKSNKLCIPASAICNGTSECPEQEDEKRCSLCNADEFMCENKKCIPSIWICDRTDDCGDASDEKPENCVRKVQITETKLDVPCNGFRCKSGDCIDLDLVCNGKHDCFDGSDEDGMCSTSCELGNNPCTQICAKTPTGPRCKCRQGYFLKNDDGKTCIDIDECKIEPPTCSQLCFNHPGNHLCDCYSNFELKSDKTSCKAIGEPMRLIFTSDNQVRELSQKENMLKLIYSEETSKITGLAHSVSTGDVYISFENTETLVKINKNSNKKEVLDNIGSPKKLALDWVTNNVYFFNSVSYSRSIDVCNFETKTCATLIRTDIHSQISNLVVDSVNRMMFYSVTSWFIFNSPRYTLYKAYLDGSEKQAIVKDSPGHITGLTYDINKKQLYYVDQHLRVINRLNYDGTMKHTVFENISYPLGLEFFENHLYYYSSGGMMHRCKLFQSKMDETFKLDNFNNGLFIISQESLQPKSEDLCRNHTCSYMCLPGKNNFKCICEDGETIGENEECQENEGGQNSEAKKYSNIEYSRHDHSDGSLNAFLLSILLVSCIIFVGAVGVYLVKRRRNSGEMNFGISFHNATYGLERDEKEKTTVVLTSNNQHEYANPMNFDPTELQTTANRVLQKAKPLIEI